MSKSWKWIKEIWRKVLQENRIRYWIFYTIVQLFVCNRITIRYAKIWIWFHRYETKMTSDIFFFFLRTWTLHLRQFCFIFDRLAIFHSFFLSNLFFRKKSDRWYQTRIASFLLCIVFLYTRWRFMNIKISGARNDEFLKIVYTK